MRCKFRLDKIEQFNVQAPTGAKEPNGREIYAPRLMCSLHMAPVNGHADPAHENSRFWMATPQGKVELMTVSAAAVAGMQVGAEYYIDITPAA